MSTPYRSPTIFSMAPMRSAHICSGARTPSARGAPCTTWSRSRSANRIPIFRLGAVICPTLTLLRWIAEREGSAA